MLTLLGVIGGVYLEDQAIPGAREAESWFQKVLRHHPYLWGSLCRHLWYNRLRVPWKLYSAANVRQHSEDDSIWQECVEYVFHHFHWEYRGLRAAQTSPESQEDGNRALAKEYFCNVRHQAFHVHIQLVWNHQKKSVFVRRAELFRELQHYKGIAADDHGIQRAGRPPDIHPKDQDLKGLQKRLRNPARPIGQVFKAQQLPNKLMMVDVLWT